MHYVSPTYRTNSFNCPHCNAFAQQSWEIKNNQYNYQTNKYELEDNNTPKIMVRERSSVIDTIAISTCQACQGYHVWHNGEIIFPQNSPIDIAVEEMPDAVKLLYNEARDVYLLSPKSACALLRLALQTLCNTLLEKDIGLNDAIQELVRDKKLPVMLQQALDSIRVIGNNAVHPGKIDIDDNKEIAATLFMLLNLVVEKMIIEPKRIEEVYMRLPEGVRAAIDKRDQVKEKTK